MKTFYFIILILLGTQAVAADVESTWSGAPKERAYFTPSQKITNFGIVYATQWTVFYLDQRPTIEQHGSFDNWVTNPFKPTFDKDSFDYNIFKHSLNGAAYHLWYRSRGYDVKTAFMWSFLSSMAFEFTIESVTERPSYQDIYQTPVFGAVLGIGFEKISNSLHALDTWYGHLFGYIFNPFTLIPQQSEVKIAAAPVIDHDMYGAFIIYRY